MYIAPATTAKIRHFICEDLIEAENNPFGILILGYTQESEMVKRNFQLTQ